MVLGCSQICYGLGKYKDELQILEFMTAFFLIREVNLILFFIW